MDIDPDECEKYSKMCLNIFKKNMKEDYERDCKRANWESFGLTFVGFSLIALMIFMGYVDKL